MSTEENTNTSNIANISSETINDIQNLQSIEMELFDTLETGLANNTLTQEEQTKIVDKINKISHMRTSLYKDVNDIYIHYQGSVSNIEYVINQQLYAVIVIENELNISKIRIQKIEQDKNNKIRLVEINTYYSEKYNSNTQIMKIIVIICVIIIILSILYNKSILPVMLFFPLTVIVIVVGIIILWYKIIDSYSHDNMNYQEYNWNQPPTNITYDTSAPTGTNPWSSPNATTITSICTGQECCETGFTYVSEPNKCIINSDLPSGILPYSTTGTSTGTTST